MRTIRFVIVSLGVVLVIAALGAGNLVLRSGTRTQPVPQGVLGLARAGVSRNSHWDPILRLLDGLSMALVPAGCFTMGSTDTQLAFAVDSCERFFGAGKCQVDFRRAESPAHRVCFDNPFWIGETEVTNRTFGTSSSTNPDAMYRGPDWPRETVTWDEASHFCQSRGARLPTEAEWEYAARGPDDLVFPWGNDFDLENLTSGRLSPADVGSVQAGVSWVGAFDLSGGVAEWVADWYGPYDLLGSTNPKGPPIGEQRVLRGGSWFSFAAFFLRTSYREAANPGTANSTIGFRCARDLE